MTEQYATTPIRTDVSPSIHPDVTLPHADLLGGVSGPGNHAYAEAREALATIYECIGQINDTETALLAAARHNGRQLGAGEVVMDGAVVRLKHGREVEFGQAAQRAFDRAAQRYDGSMARIRKGREALAKRLVEAVGGEQSNGPLAGEIRAHFKSLGSAGERAEALIQSADAKDTGTLRAVLNAPAFLSGLSAQELARLRDEACRRVAPDVHGQLLAVDQLLEKVRQAGSALMGRMTEVRQACEREAASPRAKAERQLRVLSAS